MQSAPTWKIPVRVQRSFSKVWALADRLSSPINHRPSHQNAKLGAEAFWPTTLDQESYKAARILRSFCSTCML